MSRTSAERFPLITEEAMEELRARIGVEFHGPQPWLTEANVDAIRHYADGIGDTNPLRRDREYAAKTRWGKIVAPPAILYGFDRIVSGYVGGLPGVHAMFAGTDFQWHKPILEGDRITATAVLKDLIERSSQFSGRAVQQIYQIVFKNQNGETVCVADSWCFRTQRDVAREKGKYREVKPREWTDDEIAAIAEAYEREEIRGATPRFWEDVNEGDTLPTILKGPMTTTSFIAYAQGWGGLYIRAHGLAFEMFRKHPALGIRNQQNVPEPPERVHWDHDLARKVGVPAAYDYGPERVSWLSHLVTNWMGDDGFLKRLNAQVRRHCIVGDLTRCSGKVLRKYQEGNDHLVEIDVAGTNQDGEINSKGTATVALPSRNG